ncbi:hypothetical protein ACF0H5_016014 [Mactra antiquata]
MAKVTIETLDGVKAEFIHGDGVSLPKVFCNILPYGEDYSRHVQDIKEMHIKPDDLCLITYPKCGSHWGWEIISMLLKGNTDYEKQSKENVFLDFIPAVKLKERESPRILNSHFMPRLLPKEMIENKTKIVHLMRNPKDAFVSMFYHNRAEQPNSDMAKDFKTYLPFVLGTYGVCLYYNFFDFIKSWEEFTQQHPEQILNLYFEDLKEDPEREIRKINKFLGTERDDELIHQIADACNFANLKKADTEIKAPADGWPKLDFMYRKGEVGDWKNHFTVSLNEEMDKWIGENGRGSHIKFRYTL